MFHTICVVCVWCAIFSHNSQRTHTIWKAQIELCTPLMIHQLRRISKDFYAAHVRAFRTAFCMILSADDECSRTRWYRIAEGYRMNNKQRTQHVCPRWNGVNINRPCGCKATRNESQTSLLAVIAQKSRWLESNRCVWRKLVVSNAHNFATS